MKRILIAEDEFIERMVLKKILEKKFGDQCEVLEAEKGTQALEIFRSTDIHIVILDIEMPGIKGVQAAEIMRREKQGFCIIFLTAYDKFEYAKKAIAVRAMDYLLKPYSERELISVVDEAIHLTEKYEKVHAEREDESGAGVEETDLSLMGDYNQTLLTEEGTDEGTGEIPPSRLNVLVAMVEEYVKKNFMHEISMQDAARAVNYSDAYFSKMFKQQFGLNFTAYLTEYRIEEAKKMLCQPAISVKDIGVRVGYPDSNYFARVFRRMNGVSPSEYRMGCLKEL